MKKVPFLRPTYFVWSVVALASFAFIEMQGAPHVIWSYDWQPLGSNSYADFSQRHYTRCTYVGLHSTVTDFPTDGRCGWFRFADNAEPTS